MSVAGNDQRPAKYGPLPLVIGVTGHRDLIPPDHSELEEKVRSFFSEIREKYPHTPLTLLSPLAEGADRLVARVALDLDIRLIVPLPMRQEFYQTDFTTRASSAEFDELLSRADHFFVLPLARGYCEDEIQKPGEARNYQYEHVGAYIARHSQILLALWDGVCTDSVGSTSAIIRFQMEGIPEPYAPPRSQLDAGESGEVYHIATPRMKNPQLKIKPFSVRKLCPNVDPCDDHQQPLSPSNIQKHPTQEDERAKMYDRIYERIDKFNRDALEQASKLASKLEQNKNDILPREEIESLPIALKAMRERYAMADTLAIYFQGRTKKILIALFICTFLAAVLLGVYAHIEYEPKWLHELVLVCSVFITLFGYFILYFPAKRKDYQNKYQDYRALAEGMRVQFFWCLANLKLSVADHYLRKQRTELDWICNAVHAWNLPEEDEIMKPAVRLGGMKGIELVYEYWVTNQRDYFKTSAGIAHEKVVKTEALVKGLFWAGVMLAFLLAVALLATHCAGDSLETWLGEVPNRHGLLIIVISTLLVGAALFHNYAEKGGWVEHDKQYNRMAHLFAVGEQRLREIIQHGNYQAAQTLIEELGKEALAENGDWVLLHRERPLEMPQSA